MIKVVKRKNVIRILVTIVVLALLAANIPAITTYASGTSTLAGAEIPDKFDDKYNVINALDISIWNKEITDSEWKILKKKGIQAVFIRAGYSRLYTGFHAKDSRFKENMKGAKKAGMRIGVYYFTTATNTDEARSEAEYLIDLIEPYRDDITLPVVYDFESNESGRLRASTFRALGVEGCTNLCLAFCETIENAGYEPMIYANRATFNSFLDMDVLEGSYRLWLAQFTSDGSATGYEGSYDAWQYSSSVKIDGVDSTFDANYIFERKSSAETENKSVAEADSSGKSSDSNAAFSLSGGVLSVVPVSSEGKTAHARIRDIDGLSHRYKVFKLNDKYTAEETVLACLLNGFFTSKHDIDPEFVSDSVVPVVIGKDQAKDIGDGEILSMSGICKVLSSLGLDAKYVREINEDKKYVDIKSHLAKGKPVILSIKDGSSRWSNGNEIILLLGLDESGYAIMADIKDRFWSENDQRIKLINADELIESLQSEGDSEDDVVERASQQGGYILIN